MEFKRYHIVILAVLVVLGTREKSFGQGPLGSAFTYQGRLLVDDEPVNGSYDFKFKLYEDPDGITQVGSTIQLDSQQVVDGLVTVQLDFGAQAFTGPNQRRWLLTRLKASSGIGCPIFNPNCDLYTSLLPRQELTPAPHAMALPGFWPDGFGNMRASGSVQSSLFLRGSDVRSDSTVFAGDATAWIEIDGLNQRIRTLNGTLSFTDSNLVTSGIIESTAGGIKFPDGSIMTEVPATFVKNALEASDGSPTNAVYVDAVGKVGIGTTSPPQKLSLFGGDFLLKTSDNAADQSILFQNLGSYYTWRIYRTEATTDQAEFRIAGGKQLDPSALTDHLTIKRTGEIGIGTSLAIGTTTPQVGSFATLHVMGSQLGALRVDHADGTPFVRLDRDYATLGGASGLLSLVAPDADAITITRHSPALILGGSHWTGTSATDDFYWIGAKVDSASDTRLSFGAGLSGSVMMSVAPSGLDLNGTAKLFNSAGNRTIEISPNDSEIRLYNDLGLERIAIDGKTTSGGGVIRIDNNLGNQTIAVLGDDFSGAGELTVLGQVGIGTTAPDAALHVKANGSFRGNHIAFFESTTASGGDGIAIQVANTDTNAGNNFLTFYNGNATPIGRIEGYDFLLDGFDLAGLETILNSLPSFSELLDVSGFLDPGSLEIHFGHAELHWEKPSLNFDALAPAAQLGLAIHDLTCWAITNGVENMITADPFDLIVGLVIFEEMAICKDGGVSYMSGGGDYAEWLPKLDPLEQFTIGQVVGVHGGKISKKTVGAESIMAISKMPIVLGNLPPEEDLHKFEKVAFLGQVRALVRGCVKSGDYILPSGFEDGIGVAVSPDDLKIEHLGRILGRAWSESTNGVVSMITVAVGLNTNDYTEILKRQQDQMLERDCEFAALKADHARLKAQMDTVSAKLTTMLASMEKVNTFMVSQIDGLGYETQTTAVAIR